MAATVPAALPRSVAGTAAAVDTEEAAAEDDDPAEAAADAADVAAAAESCCLLAARRGGCCGTSGAIGSVTSNDPGTVTVSGSVHTCAGHAAENVSATH